MNPHASGTCGIKCSFMDVFLSHIACCLRLGAGPPVPRVLRGWAGGGSCIFSDHLEKKTLAVLCPCVENMYVTSAQCTPELIHTYFKRSECQFHELKCKMAWKHCKAAHLKLISEKCSFLSLPLSCKPEVSVSGYSWRICIS